MMRCAFRAISLVALIGALGMTAGCTTQFGGRNADFKTEGASRPNLEVPPDLVTPGATDRYAIPNKPEDASLATYNQARAGGNKVAADNVLPKPGTGLRIERSGTTRWLVAQGTPEKLWPELRAFWVDSGFTLAVDKPELGVMETGWAENRANIPMDTVRKFLGKIADSLYDSGLRDRFRIRMERSSESGAVEIYFSHQGAAEKYVDNIQTRWETRPADPILEAEMLNRFMARLSGDKKQEATASAAAKTTVQAAPERARIVEAGGAVSLQVDQDLDRAWRQVGSSLDRIGLVVEDRDRAKGIYYVRYVVSDDMKKKDDSIWSKMAFWKSSDPAAGTAQYRVLVKAESAEQTSVLVQDKDGAALATGSARQMLSLLQNQLK